MALLLSAVLLAGFDGTAPSRPQGGDDAAAAPLGPGRYFPETGFWVADPFLTFWDEHGGLVTFGYPLSRVFYQDGLHRQYFERAVLEWHEDLAGTPYEVLGTRLGALTTMDRRGEPAFQPVAEPADACDDYPETGHRLCAGFRDYWNAHGGLPAFGYPISEEFTENGRTVQYFERARMEWHPELAPPFDILLGHLGREALADRPVPAEAVTPEPASNGPAPVIGPRPLYEDHAVACGLNLIWWGDIDNQPTNAYFLDRARATGCAWIRVQGQWSALEPEPERYAYEPLDRVVDAARARGLRVLVQINSPTWWGHTRLSGRPADPALFARFMGSAAAHFRGRVDAWQLWNEPNLAIEAAGLIDPRGYYEMVRAAAPAVRAADPHARIVLAGMAPNSLNDPHWAVGDIQYLSELLAIDNGAIRNDIDVIAVHAYGAGNAPDTYWPGNLAQTPGWNEWPEFYFRHAEDVRRLLLDAGLDDVPVWITEFGWTIENAWPDYGYGDWVSPEDQAAYLTRAIEIARTEWPWVEAMFAFSLNAAVAGGEGGPYYGFSLLDQYGQPRPAYAALAAVPKEAGGQSAAMKSAMPATSANSSMSRM